MVKKIKINLLVLLWLVVFILLNTTNVKAIENCKIEETPQYINSYIENIHKVVNNVNTIVSKKNKSNSSNLSNSLLRLNTIRNITWSMNRLFTWDWYELDFEYSTQESIWEIPKQLKRDINILKNEYKNLKLANPEWSNIIISTKEICKWINNCNFNMNSDYNALLVIENLKRSTNNIIKILINQAVDYRISNHWKIYFINYDQLIKDYSKLNIKKCNLSSNDSWEKWFFATIIEKIKNIDLLNKNSKDSIKDWKEAVNLLWWTSDNIKSKQKNKELLTKGLEKQWIWGQSTQAITSNSNGYETTKWKDSFLKDKQWFFDSIQLHINYFDEAIEKKFPWYKKWNPSWENISTQDIESEINKLKKNQKKEINLNSQYSKLRSLSVKENTSNDILINKMINIHISISEMINTLNKTCEISVKVCNSQKRWQWDCGQCY